ncbi:MAG: hypothetical protein IJ729_03550 [Alloprevotella sp.]|nr:hypothetical protein [Alloprevotella sp.]
MKPFRRITAVLSLLTFAASFATFIISVFAGWYGNLILTGLTAAASFLILLLAAGTPDNETYLRHIRRRR